MTEVNTRSASLILDYLNDAVLKVDQTGKILGSNFSTKKVFGYDSCQLIDQNIKKLFASFEDSKIDIYLKKSKIGLDSQIVERGIEIVGRQIDGINCDLEFSFYASGQNDPQELIFVFTDPLKRNSTVNHSQDFSYYDPITRLPNRHLFNDRLNQSIAHSMRHKELLALMVLDLNVLKEIYSPVKFAMRDQVLRESAKRLCDSVRIDDTVCRLQGEKFAVLFPQIKNEESASFLAEKIFKNFVTPLCIIDNEISITPSLGISIYPNDGEETQVLLEKAQLALFQVQKNNKKFGFFNHGLHAKTIRRNKIEKALSLAIPNDELRVYYQPKLDLESKKISGLEALVRWERPGFGLVSPGEFITIAEETGLIWEIGEWVLKQACEQNIIWQNEGFQPLPVAVNLSPKQFSQGDLEDLIKKTLLATGLAPEFLDLEVTESAVMENKDETIKTLRKLRDLGVGIGIDDFGTGYSSLSYISSLPNKFIKIDKSFLKNINSKTDQSIINAIVDMARGLNLETIVEGVETETQFELCNKLGCCHVQGYLISRPLPAKDISKLLSCNVYEQLQIKILEGKDCASFSY